MATIAPLEPQPGVLSTTPLRQPWLDRLARRWRLLALFALAGGGAGAGISFLLPPWYAAGAQLTVVAASAADAPNPDSVVAAAGALLPTLAAMAQSRPVLREVAERAGLAAEYHARSADEAARRLRQRLTVLTERRSMVVVLTVEDRDPARAQAIAAALVAAVSAHQEALWSSRSRADRLRLQAQLDEADGALARASAALRAFRERHHVVDLPAQTKAAVDAAAGLARLARERRMALHFARGAGGEEAPDVMRGRRELAGVYGQLHAVAHRASGAGALLPLDQLPALEEEDARLQRAVDQAAARQKLLLREVDQLRVAELRPIAGVGVIEAPTRPDHRSRPSRARWALGCALAALALAASLVLGRARA